MRFLTPNPSLTLTLTPTLTLTLRLMGLYFALFDKAAHAHDAGHKAQAGGVAKRKGKRAKAKLLQAVGKYASRVIRDVKNDL